MNSLAINAEEVFWLTNLCRVVISIVRIATNFSLPLLDTQLNHLIFPHLHLAIALGANERNLKLK